MLDTSIAKPTETKPIEYWQHLGQVISAEVEATLAKHEDARRPLVTYLRDLERAVRVDGGRRQTAQLIASGRRLLGDRSNIDSAGEPFARLPSAAP